MTGVDGDRAECDGPAMNRRLSLFALPLLASLFLSSLAPAQPVENLPAMKPVALSSTRSTTLAGELPPGGKALYTVQAKAGQTLMVSVMPVSTGLTFQVFRTDAAVARAADGQPLVTGATLPDAGPADQARAWIGALPRDGVYYVLLARDAAAAPAPSAYNLTFGLQ